MDVEVNAMNILGLRYVLNCRGPNKYLLDEQPVITYVKRLFPPMRGEARRYGHVIVDLWSPMDESRERLLGKDKLVSELALRNDETAE